METTKPMLPKEAINEFKRLYAARFKKDLPDDEISIKATNLFELYKAVYGTVSNHTRA